MLRHSVSALFSTRLAGIWHLAINSNTGYQWLPFCPSFADWEIFDYLWLFYTSQNFPKHILQICQKPWQNLLQFSRRVKPIQYTSATQKYQFSFRCKHLEVWYGLVWFGGVFGMVWYGLVWFGMVWYGLVWFGGVYWGTEVLWTGDPRTLPLSGLEATPGTCIVEQQMLTASQQAMDWWEDG